MCVRDSVPYTKGGSLRRQRNFWLLQSKAVNYLNIRSLFGGKWMGDSLVAIAPFLYDSETLTGHSINIPLSYVAGQIIK